MKKGLLLAAIHVGMVLSVSGRYLVDRMILPKVWVKTIPVDPNLPIRGRYLALSLELDLPGVTGNGETVKLNVEDGKLTAHKSSDGKGVYVWRNGAQGPFRLDGLAYFIPAAIPDPSRVRTGEELWMEISVPANGLPRPVQLGLRRDGVLSPLKIN